MDEVESKRNRIPPMLAALIVRDPLRDLENDMRVFRLLKDAPPSGAPFRKGKRRMARPR